MRLLVRLNNTFLCLFSANQTVEVCSFSSLPRHWRSSPHMLYIASLISFLHSFSVATRLEISSSRFICKTPETFYQPD